MIKVLIDINHPAHVHLFKNFAWEMKKKGHKIFFTTRDKECTIQLLEYYKFDFISFGKHYKKKLGKIFGLFKFNLLLLLTSIKFKPDIFLSHGSIYAAHTAFLLRKLNIAFEDTGNKEQVSLYKPFTKFIFTSNVFEQNYGIKQIRYNAYHELAYLHPNQFKPDPDIFNLLKIKKNEKYVILRFVSWNASHEFGFKGITQKNKKKVIKILSKKAQVFISSEGELPEDIKKYKITIPPEKMHDALYYASLLYSESATMASECAVLGTPAIYLDKLGRSYTDEQEKKYKLVYNYTESLDDQEKSINKASELINTPNLKQEWNKRRRKMLEEKIDVTTFLVWFFENYPNSINILRQNSDFQHQFK